jgi:KaiC/GvpD/RAD55 family RecA-like ATPase
MTRLLKNRTNLNEDHDTALGVRETRNQEFNENRAQGLKQNKSRNGSISSGVIELDRILGGGFPKGTFVCLEGDIGTGTSTFCIQTVWSRLTSGGLAAYICLDELPDTVIQHFRSFGYDIEKYIEMNRFLLYDGMPFLTSLAASNGQNGATGRKSLLGRFLEEYKNAVCAARRKNAEITLPGITVVDSFSSLAPYIDLKAAYILAHMIANSARNNKNLFLVVVHTGPIEANIVCACNATADGIIKLEQYFRRRALKRIMRIEKMAFTQTPNELLEFKITSKKGVEIMRGP